MSKVIIIGGGVAGLSAAYELLKNDPKIDLTLLEADDRVGGNIYSAKVGKDKLDVGALQIWDWYFNLMDIIEDLDLRKKMDVSHWSDFYVQNDCKDGTSYSIAKNSDIFNDMSIQEKIKTGQLLIDLLEMPDSKLSMYSNSLDNTETVYDFIVRNYGEDTKLVDLTRSFYEGYTYGPIEKMEMSLVLPLITRNGVEYSFMGNTELLVGELEKNISKKGKIVYNARVKNINVSSGSKNKVKTTSGKTYEADEIIIASPISDLHHQLIPSLKK